MAISTRTRRAVSTVLALVLAVETVTAVAAAAATRTVTHPLPADPPAGVVLAAEATAQPAATPAAVAAPAEPAFRDTPDFVKPATVIAPAVAPAEEPAKAEASKRDRAKDRERSKAERATRRERAAARDDRPSTSGRTADRERERKPVYAGRNHVWIPSLGINRSIRWFPCDRERPPDNFLYRWGCAGANNVYLMGHAYSVMEPLHDAYVRGTLRKGMKAWYADASGRVRAYAVKWWKVTLPTTDAAWAWAPQGTPSMTLQTCVGKNSKYRLMVRLVQVKG
jgi:hypothetical protein